MTPDPDAAAEYRAFAARLEATGLVTDPWVAGRPRFRARPLPLPARDADRLVGAAEAVGVVHQELVAIVAGEPDLMDRFFQLTPVQKVLFASSAPLWHGIARADTFLLEDPDAPPVICELNCDTPSGLAEVTALGALGARPDPNRGIEEHFARLVRTFLASVDRPPGAGRPTVGLCYPTELAGDFGLVRLYQAWCERAGFDVVLGSPFNLHATAQGGLGMFGRQCDLLLRHYKTDWWGERRPIWDDEAPYADEAPLGEALAVVLRALAHRRCAVLNPLASVLPQNKRSLAFFWERQELFSAEAQAAIRAHMPETRLLEATSPAQLVAEQADWVLKSDYGCEGEEVIIGRDSSAAQWTASLEHAVPGRWVAQRHFQAARDPDALTANHGVYLIAGRAAGLYTRLSAGATDAAALSVPVEIHS